MNCVKTVDVSELCLALSASAQCSMKVSYQPFLQTRRFGHREAHFSAQIPKKMCKWFIPSTMLPYNEDTKGGDQMLKADFNSFNNFIQLLLTTSLLEPDTRERL